MSSIEEPLSATAKLLHRLRIEIDEVLELDLPGGPFLQACLHGFQLPNCRIIDIAVSCIIFENVDTSFRVCCCACSAFCRSTLASCASSPTVLSRSSRLFT